MGPPIVHDASRGPRTVLLDRRSVGPRTALPRTRPGRGTFVRHPPTAVVVDGPYGRAGLVSRGGPCPAGDSGAWPCTPGGTGGRRRACGRSARGRSHRLERARRSRRRACGRLRARADCRSRIRRGRGGARRLARHLRAGGAGRGERDERRVRRPAREPGGRHRTEHRRLLLRSRAGARGRVCRGRTRAASDTALVPVAAAAARVAHAKPATARRRRCQSRSAGARGRAGRPDFPVGALHRDASRRAHVVPR